MVAIRCKKGILLLEYNVFEENITDESFNKITLYGIEMPDGTVIHDVTDCLLWISQLVNDLNYNKVERVHIFDVIDDFLFDKMTVFSKLLF